MQMELDERETGSAIKEIKRHKAHCTTHRK